MLDYQYLDFKCCISLSFWIHCCCAWSSCCHTSTRLDLRRSGTDEWLVSCCSFCISNGVEHKTLHAIHKERRKHWMWLSGDMNANIYYLVVSGLWSTTYLTLFSKNWLSCLSSEQRSSKTSFSSWFKCISFLTASYLDLYSLWSSSILCNFCSWACLTHWYKM